MASSSSPRKRKHSSDQENAGGDSDSDYYDEEEGGQRVDGIYIPPPTKPALTLDPNGPRLLIIKIVNNFFKSYAEEQVLGPFHKCFNAIVGPNGSGKSNVIDSMLFVFGYRATKIRSKKISVLLHNSENHRNVQSCTVSVHFALVIDREGDNYDVVPGSEFVVSRTANKDNSSFYTLNNKRVHFKEVGNLLKQHGIDLQHNRFLILQGEVEQIAMMKCKAQTEHESGMLEYLEDVIGTSRYKKPLTKLHDRVELLNEKRTEKLNRLRLIEKELEELKGPMEEAIGFLKTENTIVQCHNFIYQKNIQQVQVQCETAEKELEEHVNRQKELAEKIAEFAKEKENSEKLLEEEAKKYESLEKRKEGLKQSYNKANNKDVELQETMILTNKNRKKTKDLLAEEQKKLEKMLKQPEESKNGIEEAEKKQQQLKEKLEKSEEQRTKLLSALREETKALQEKREDVENDLLVLKKTEEETKSAFCLAESELKIYMSSEVTEQSKLEELTALYEKNDKLIKERLEQTKLLEKKIPATEKSLKNATDELNEVRLKESKIITEIRSKKYNLEEKRNSMNASRSRGKVLDSLMRQAREGNCKGIFGRLGDLGAIDQKYDVAISTACGPLDNIVVDTVETAQWCIEFLKKHDIGRGTFIALDKQEHLGAQANSKIKTPENVPRLYDMIKIQDERVKTAFYYALQDTLVASDLEQASRIAYGNTRYRVVTLSGDLIETTGTMSGGGKQVSRGRMGQKVAVCNIDPKELENLEQEVEGMEDTVRQLRRRTVELEDQIAVLEPELRRMKIDQEKFTIEIKSLQEQHPSIARQLKDQKEKAKSAKSDPATVKKLTDVVEKKKAAYDKAMEATGKLQEVVDQLNKEIKQKTAGKMNAVDKSIKEAKTGIDKCKTEITRLRVAMNSAARNSEKSKEKIATMQADITDMENRLTQMKKERDEVEEDAAKLLTCLNDVTEQLESAEETYNEVKKNMDKLNKQDMKFKSEQIDVDEKVKQSNKVVSDIKATIHQWEVKISKLKLQEIPDKPIEELKKFSEEELDERSLESVQKELEKAEQFLKAAQPNLSSIQEYKKKQLIFVERSNELEGITSKRLEMRKLYDNLRIQRKDEFLTGYNIIKLKLKEMYQMITLGGDADFEMVDSFDPFTEGIQFNVRPPKKSWKKIENLSGGEKTLSSLALVFALHYYKPSPLYVMDEIDAALDFKNVSIVGHYIKERTKNAQFIIISLRSNMFELCDNLVGIYKTYNCTKSITIDPREQEKADEPQDQVVPQFEDQVGVSSDETEGDKQPEDKTNKTVNRNDSNELTASKSNMDEQLNTSIADSFIDEEMEVDDSSS